MNRYPLFSKLLMIGALVLLLALALALVRGVVAERSAYRQAATQEVSMAHAGAQTVIGPVIWLPYTETGLRTVKVDGEGQEGQAGKDGSARVRDEWVTEERALLIFPKSSETRSELSTEQRQRGIFPVTVYTSRHLTRLRFEGAAVQPRTAGGKIVLGQPQLLFGVSDARGLLGAPQLTLGGQTLPLRRAPAGAPLPLAAPLDLAQLRPGEVLEAALQFELAGTRGIGWVPLADDNLVTLKSPWPHPNFGGNFLPRTRQVSDAGFEATWRVSALSTQAQTVFSAKGAHAGLEQFVVWLADPVDTYRLSERATKYGLLFIVLTFAAFFVLEVVKRWRIHPMQYLMIGAALVLFFLLLLSMSEHMAFAAAYGAASAACIALLAHYLRHVLGGWAPGLAMSGLLVGLYGVLYGILISEDNALLMGSVLLFGVLAAVMTVTRKLDWYHVIPVETGTAPRGPTEA